MAEKKATSESTAKKKTVATSAKKKTSVSKSTTTKKETTTTKKTSATKKVVTVTSKKPIAKETKVIEEVKPIEVEVKKEEVQPIYKEEVTFSSNEKTKKVRYKLSIRKLLLLCLVLAVIVVAVIFGFKIFGNKPSYKDKASYTESFFIKNKEGKYALYSDSGKQYTNFIYESAGRFISDHTVVQNKKGEYGVIDSKGKTTVEFGKYNYITDYSGLYKVRSDKGYALINNKGKVLVDAEQLDVTSYGTDYPVIIALTDDTVYVFMYDGTKITTFKKKSGAKNPSVNYIEGYATVFYNKENVVINLNKKEEKLRFKSNVHYCVNGVTDNGKTLSYNACTSWFETLTETGHKISNGKNVIDLSNKCDQVYVYGDTLLCSKGYDKYFINVKKNKAKLSKKLSTTIAFVDNENYAYKDESNYNTVFIKKGKKVKSIDASLSSIGKLNEKMYVLYVDGSYEFYNLSGKKVIKDSFKIAYPFDVNGLAKVSEDGKDKYLINTKGKKVSSEYSDIKNEDKYYITTDKNGKKGIINDNGKEIISPKYESIVIKTFRDKYYAVLGKDGKSTIYNLSKKKEILGTKDSVSLTEHYIKTMGNKTNYYTYSNKLIYSEK